MKRSHELFKLYRAAHGFGKYSDGITEEDVIGWAANLIKVGMEYYNSEIADCLDPDCEVCESMQKLGYFLGGLVKRLPGAHVRQATWLLCKKRRYKDLRIGHELTCPCQACNLAEALELDRELVEELEKECA